MLKCATRHAANPESKTLVPGLRGRVVVPEKVFPQVTTHG